MFSNNGEISNHQTTRLLILDVFTGAVLFLPGTLARICGSGGLTALILGLLLTLADGALLAWSFRRCGSALHSGAGTGHWRASAPLALRHPMHWNVYFFDRHVYHRTE